MMIDRYQRISQRSRTCVPSKVALDYDRHGSPVTLEAASWFVCFVPGLRKQWWHRFVHEKHKHVFAMRPEPSGSWTIFEPWWQRLLTATITAEQAQKFLAWAATGDVLLVREEIPGNGSQIRGWMNCAVLVSFLLGRGYWAWTPHRFYRQLARETRARAVDVSLLLTLDAKSLATVSGAIAVRDRYTDQILQTPFKHPPDAGESERAFPCISHRFFFRGCNGPGSSVGISYCRLLP